MVFSLQAKLIAGAVALAAAAALWGYVNHLSTTIKLRDQTITNLTTENTIIKANNALLESSINANNEAISVIAAGASDTKAAFASLNKNVQQHIKTLDGRLKDILSEQKPETCEATIKYLLDAAVGGFAK